LKSVNLHVFRLVAQGVEFMWSSSINGRGDVLQLGYSLCRSLPFTSVLNFYIDDHILTQEVTSRDVLLRRCDLY
jgi:hypothetical protein